MSIEKTIKKEYERKPVAAVCCFIIGLLNISLLIYFLTPAGARYESAIFYEEFLANPYFSFITWNMLVVTALLSAAAILPAANSRFTEEKEEKGLEWLQLTGILAILGWGVLAASFLTLLGKVPDLATNYANGSPTVKEAIVAVGLPELDPHEVLAMGCPGIWFITVNSLAIKKKKWSPVLAAFGILAGVCYIATVFASLFVFEPLNYFAIGGGALAAPVWNIWLGIVFIRKEKTTDTLPDKKEAF
jgi:hypothetical protein